MKKVSNQVFNGLPETQVYATIGNHDTYPLDSFWDVGPRTNEARLGWSGAWEQFFDDENPEEQSETFKDYGCYSQPLTFKNGTQIGNKPSKLISFNSNWCYNSNYAQLATFRDPGNVMQWLENELSGLEKVGGAAIMLSHVPNIDECNRQIGKRWHALMDRYQHVVRWGMSAHTHLEQWQVSRDVYT